METDPAMQIFDWKLFRRDVRRDVRNCALFLFFFFAIYIIAALVVVVAHVLTSPSFLGMMSDPTALMGMAGPFSNPEVSNLTDDLTASLEESAGLMSIVSIAAGSCVFFILRKRRFITDLAMPMSEPLTPKIFIVLVLATQAIQLVYSLIVMLVDELLPEGLSILENYGEAMAGLSNPIGIAYIVLIGPIFEELIFRGAVMGTLRRYGDNFAIIISSLLFGFYHAIILQIPFGFVMGLLLGYAAARWSLRVSIALHIIVNGLSALLSETGNEDFATAGGLAMITCTILTVVFWIKWRDVFKARVRSGAAYYSGTYANGFSSIALWIFLVVMAAAGVLMMSVMPTL